MGACNRLLLASPLHKRVCAALANQVLTRELRRDPLGRYLIRGREQVRVGGEHGLRVVPEPRGDDVDRDAGRQRQRRARVAQDVERPRGDARRLAVPPEPVGEPLRVDRLSEPICEHEIPVGVGITGEVAFEHLRVPVLAQRVYRLPIERDRPPGAGRLRRAEADAAAGGDQLLLHRELELPGEPSDPPPKPEPRLVKAKRKLTIDGILIDGKWWTKGKTTVEQGQELPADSAIVQRNPRDFVKVKKG
jgi:hypothetical protein